MATTDKKSLLSEDCSTSDGILSPKGRQLITDAIKESKDIRSKALANAHDALVNAFGPKLDKNLKDECEAPKQHLTEDTTMCLTMDDLEAMLPDLGFELADDEMVKECRKRLDEAKDPSISPSDKDKMYKDIHRKFWAYVQSLPNRKEVSSVKSSETDDAVKKFLTSKNCGLDWLSHEGSTIISALIAVSDGENACVSLSQLPDTDKAIVNNNIYKLIGTKYEAKFFWVRLDDYKNFIFSADTEGLNRKEIIFTIGNRVASIPPSESSRFGNTDVRVERKGKDIVIGDRIKLERNKIQNIVNPTDPTNNGANRGLGSPPRQKVSGRNAYEIRADILELALDFVRNSTDKKFDADDVLDIAEAFYGFVEHK